MAEIAAVEGVHRNTVRGWFRRGLEPIDDKHPLLFRGEAVRSFLRDRSSAAKRPCGSGEFYCFSCQTPRRPAGGLVDWEHHRQGADRLLAICERCDTVMHRFVRAADVPVICRGLEVNERAMTDAYLDPPRPLETVHSNED